MAAYYNEINLEAAAWLRELIKRNLIAPGVVDTRSILDVRPSDLAGFSQCHFFAGLGAWSLALRRAGVPDSYPVWTGSCPCQPFSAAGAGAGFDDERHLWPALYWLIAQRQPDVFFGEQVASPDGLAWLDLVSSDLQGADYTFGAADTCSASVGAPHIRQRLYYLGYSDRARLQACESLALGGARWWEERRTAEQPGGPLPIGLADTDSPEPEQPMRQGTRSHEAQGARPYGEPDRRHPLHRPGEPGPTNGFWRDADWLSCRDGKWRSVDAGTFPLADGSPKRVGLLRASGNAVNAEQARVFIEAALEALIE